MTPIEQIQRLLDKQAVTQELQDRVSRELDRLMDKVKLLHSLSIQPE